MKSVIKNLLGGFTVMSVAMLMLVAFPNEARAEENLTGGTPEVLGEATTDLSDTQKALLYAKPAVVQITDVITGQLILQASAATQLGAPSLTGQTYSFEIGFSGSGFFVTPDGYLITNGHVAKPEDDLVAYYGLYQTSEAIMKDAFAAVFAATYGVYATDEQIEQGYSYILNQSYAGDYNAMVESIYTTDYKGGNIKLDAVKKNNYIQTGEVSGTQKLVKEQGKPATLVATSYEGEFNSKDLALLKVEGSNFPTIALGTFSDVQIGKEVYAVGYPALVESATGVFTDTQSGLEPSITKGIISAKKTLVDGTEAFQTDAGITHGNSGGPVLDANGKVIGVATWSFGDNPGGESFNFLISVEQVQSLLSRNNITASESITTTRWKESLDLYSKKCYTQAKAKFNDVKALYADNVDIDDFITNAQSSIEKGEDECLGLFGISYTVLIIGGVVLGAAILIGIVLFVLLKSKKGAKAAVTPVAAPTPAAPAVEPAKAETAVPTSTPEAK